MPENTIHTKNVSIVICTKIVGIDYLSGTAITINVECSDVWKQCQKCIAEYNTCQDNESPGENCSKVWTECSEKDDNEICTGNKEFLKDMRDCLQQLLQSPPPPSP